MLKKRFESALFEGFDDKEALELLLSYAVPKRGLDAASKDLIKRFGSLKGVIEAGHDELRSIPGIGHRPASLLKLVKSVSRLYLREKAARKNVVRGRRDVIYCLRRLGASKVERLAAIYLNSANEILSVEVLQEGSVKGKFTALSKKAVSLAFRHGARSAVFALICPPKGATDPELCEKIIKVLDRAALAIDLMVHDYIFTGRAGYFSARDRGWRFGEPMGLPMAAELGPSFILPKGKV